MNIDELLTLLDGELISGDIFKKIKGFKIDTRILEKEEAFIALGGNSKGMNYIMEAIHKKASAIIVDERVEIETKVPIILVPNTYDALFKIATFYRRKYPIFYIGITGSNGKTTTKELIYTVLKEKFTVLKNEKNYNNHIGVPLTLFRLSEKYEIAIVEMGMNHKGEIEDLSKLVKPTLGIITNIGTSHIGNLGSKKNIFKAKMEITEGMEDGLLLVNGDDSYLKKVKNQKNYDVIYCGHNSSYGLSPYQIEVKENVLAFCLEYKEKEYRVSVSVSGEHFLVDILLAIEVGLLFNMEMEEIIHALSHFKASSNRMHILHKENYIIIDDCYNANYDSFKGLISYLKKRKEEKIVIVGDMLELGKYSKKYHLKLKRQLQKLKKCKVLLIGKETECMKDSKMIHFDTKEDIITYLAEEPLNGKLIVCKGSRGMHLEEIIKTL